ncbi:MAG: hypothetical protein JNM90_16500 [Burkholderiales bacterium]|nr:hypothetical protein [Burkholderiales bacterium]
MRSTRAAAAVRRLGARCPGRDFMLSSTGNGLFFVSELADGAEVPLCEPLAQDDFVRAVDAMGPQPEPRRTRHDAAFERQLAAKPADGDDGPP